MFFPVVLYSFPSVIFISFKMEIMIFDFMNVFEKVLLVLYWIDVVDPLSPFSHTAE